MLTYSQSTGILYNDMDVLGQGYSGYKEGKNNPDMQDVPFVGPIPQGVYKIGEWYNSPNVGPTSIPLEPFKHDALGRTDFLIHGDSIQRPGEASRGCIIMPRYARSYIISKGFNSLLVVP